MTLQVCYGTHLLHGFLQGGQPLIRSVQQLRQGLGWVNVFKELVGEQL